MRRAVGTLILSAGATLGLVVAVGPACTLSSTCTDGKITTDSLPDATVGQQYSFQLAQSCGGRDGVSWQVGDGQLPPGIALSWDGHLSGVPTSAGSFYFHVSVNLTSRGAGSATNSVGSDSRAYTLAVRP
jgi:hypothetical protein